MIKKDKSAANKAKLILLIGTPLLLVLSLAFIFTKAQKEETKELPMELEEEIGEQYLKEPLTAAQQQARRLNIADTLTRMPQNPTQVTVTCKSTGEQITSGQVTNCSDPVFTWSGEKARGKGVEIQGYYVYFGENNQPFIWPDHQGREDKIDPWVHGNYQSGNEFQPSEAFLEIGKTYYLMIQAVSTSKNPVHQTGRIILDQTGQRVQAAEILFEYKYQ